jgi:hypothetical protein
VDDGTSVIDCLHRQELGPQTPRKRQQAKSTPLVLPPPKPIGGVGVAVSVTGRVVKKFNTRELIATSIGSHSRLDRLYMMMMTMAI